MHGKKIPAYREKWTHELDWGKSMRGEGIRWVEFEERCPLA